MTPTLPISLAALFCAGFAISAWIERTRTRRRSVRLKAELKIRALQAARDGDMQLAAIYTAKWLALRERELRPEREENPFRRVGA